MTDEIIYMFGEAPGSIVDGPGIRYGVFCQGCVHHCSGCHNVKSQPHKGGIPKRVSEILSNIKDASSCTGVTLSGGEPFDQSQGMSALAEVLKQDNFNVWAYSGYLFEDLFAISKGLDTLGATKFCNKDHAQYVDKLLRNLDVLVDGPFIMKKKSYDALFRGSTNQRLIDVPKSLKAGKIIPWTQEFIVPEKPSSF